MKLSEMILDPTFEFDDAEWLSREIAEIEDNFYQALQRENSLQITLFEAGLEQVHPWHCNGEK